LLSLEVENTTACVCAPLFPRGIALYFLQN
jgi:hypothetical protein